MFHTQSCLCSFSIPFPADPSLTNSAVLSCLETVEYMCGILELPHFLKRDEYTREALVQFYLQISPYASWEHLACQLFMDDQTIELEKVKKRMKPDRGQKFT